MRHARRAVLILVAAACASQMPAAAPRDIGVSGPEPKAPAATHPWSVYALLIGVSKYDSNVPLSYCHRDVVQLSRLMVAMGVKPQNIVVMYDGHPDPKLQPTRGNVLAQMDALYGKTVDGVFQPGPAGAKGADVWFVFTGHGVYDTGKKASVLLPQDAPNLGKQPKEALASALPVHEIGSRLSALHDARARLMFIDACRTVRREDRVAFTEAIDNLPKNLWVFSSCKPGQQSIEDPLIRHGVFSANLINVLRGGSLSYTALTSQIEPTQLGPLLQSGVQEYMELLKRLNEKDKARFEQQPTARLDANREITRLGLFEPFAFRNSANMARAARADRRRQVRVAAERAGSGGARRVPPARGAVRPRPQAVPVPGRPPAGPVAAVPGSDRGDATPVRAGEGQDEEPQPLPEGRAGRGGAGREQGGRLLPRSAGRVGHVVRRQPVLRRPDRAGEQRVGREELPGAIPAPDRGGVGVRVPRRSRRRWRWATT